MTTEPTLSTYRRMARRSHPHCAVCGSQNTLGLNLVFHTDEKADVTLGFSAAPRYQGYTGRLHGGVIATLFDAAMTHCLFAHGLIGVTAELKVRYRYPVMAGRPVAVRAKVEKQKSHFFLLSSSLYQDGQLKASATATFRVEKNIAEQSR